MQRSLPEHLALFVPFPLVLLQAVDTAFRLVGVEVALGQDVADRVDAVLYSHALRNRDRAQAQLLQRRLAANTRHQFPDLHVMRQIVFRVCVGLFIHEHARDVPQGRVVRLVVVNQPYFRAYDLREPDRGCIIKAQVPSGVDRLGRLPRDRANASILGGLAHVAPVIGSDDRRLE